MNDVDIKNKRILLFDFDGTPGQFSDSDKVCAENAGIDYMDVVQFVGK